MESAKIWVARPEVPRFVLGQNPKPAEKAKRVGVPAGRIEVPGQRKMIKVERPSHKIVQNRAPGRKATDYFDLKTVESTDLLRRKSAKIELMRWIRFGDR